MIGNLMRSSPFDDLMALGDRIERQLLRWWSGSVRAGRMIPSSEIVPGEDGWRLRVALPGVAAGQVEATVSGRVLHMRATSGEGDASTTYEQSVTLPDAVDAERIGATYRNGLLDVTLPIKEAARPRRITIATEPMKQLDAAA